MTTVATKKPRTIRVDWNDATSLLSYIEMHSQHATDAVARKDRAKLLDQAEEIKAWAESLVTIAETGKR